MRDSNNASQRMMFLIQAIISTFFVRGVYSVFFHKTARYPDSESVSIGESFYYADGAYQYRVQCWYDNKDWPSVGLYVYAKVDGESRICFTCMTGKDGYTGRKGCTSATSSCEKYIGWPYVNIPSYKERAGRPAEFVFGSSEIFSWKELGELYMSCLINKDGKDDTVQTGNVPAKPTLGGLGWDYAEWSHWLIAFAIILGTIQVLGIIGLCLKKSKNKSLRQCSQLFICHACVPTPLLQPCLKVKAKIQKKGGYKPKNKTKKK